MGILRKSSVAFVLAMSCGGGQSPPDADTRTPIVEVPAVGNRDLDILFVVDDSGTMADKQARLATSFPSFINRLQAIPGGLPNLHLGVVSTDLGSSTENGIGPTVGAVGAGGCANTGDAGNLTINGASVLGTFASDIDNGGGRTQNFTGDLATVFGQMARLGATGCGFEQPLSAMRAALDNNPNNNGFIRSQANLAVVFLTDEDDCSAKDPALFSPDGSPQGPLQSFRCTRFGVTCAVGGATPDAMNAVGAKDQCTAATGSQILLDVAPFRDFLVTLKGEVSRIAVAGIVGNPTPVATELRLINNQNQPALAHSCTFQNGSLTEVADPAIRLETFFNLFPNNSGLSTICQGDLAGSLDLVGQLVAKSIGVPCITTLLADTDPNTAGVQPDCIVEDVLGATVTPIQPCDAAATPTCWRVVSDPTVCPLVPQLRLEVVRDAMPDPATITRMRCALDAR